MADDKYQQGVSCSHCYGTHSAERKDRFIEREKQVALAQQRGEQHIGSEVVKTMAQRRKAKLDLKRSDRENCKAGNIGSSCNILN